MRDTIIIMFLAMLLTGILCLLLAYILVPVSLLGFSLLARIGALAKEHSRGGYPVLIMYLVAQGFVGGIALLPYLIPGWLSFQVMYKVFRQLQSPQKYVFVFFSVMALPVALVLCFLITVTYDVA
jgi:hypothetical protein